jgi:hypothetical protein
MTTKIKKEVAEDTHLRKLFTFYVKDLEEDAEIKLSNADRSAMIDDLVEDFGPAVDAVVTCAVDAAFATLEVEGDDGEEEEEEGEDEGEEEEDGDAEVIEADFEDADAA